MRLHACAALVLFAASLSLASAKDPGKYPISADIAAFPALRADIEKDLKGDDYNELTRTQREDVIAALDRMETVLAGVDSIQSLDIDDRTQLFNDQELVNTVLTKARADSRTICRKEVRTGSHRLNQNCRTVAEIRRDRDESQQSLGRIQNRWKFPCDECGGGRR